MSSIRRVVTSIPYSLGAIGLLFLCLLGSGVLPELWGSLALAPCETLTPPRIVTLLTYWLVLGSLANWLFNSISIALSGLVIERALSLTRFFVLLFGGVLVGGLIFALMSPSCDYLVGPVMISWAFAGCAFAAIIVTWRTAPRIAKLYPVYIIFSLINLVGAPVPIIVAQLGAGAFGIGFALMVRRRFGWHQDAPKKA